MRVLLAVVCLPLTLSLFAQQPSEKTQADQSSRKPHKSAATGVQDVLPFQPSAITPTNEADAALSEWASWETPYPSTVQRLVPNKTLQLEKSPFCVGGAACSYKADQLYVFHVSDWNLRNTKEGLRSSFWYFYHGSRDGKTLRRVHIFNKAPDTIYGVADGQIISVVIVRNTNDSKQLPGIKYTITTKEKTATNVLALEALAQAVLSVKPAPENLTSIDGGSCPKDPETKKCLVYSAKITRYPIANDKPHAPFTWTVAAKVSPPVEKPKDDANLVVPQSDPDSGNVPSKPKGTGDTSAKPDTSGCNELKTGAVCGFSQAVSIEGKQYWNVGIDITPHGPREYKYALSNSNIVTQSHTIHSPLYAAFDFSFWPQQSYRPYFQAGVPLSGAAFHLPFVAVAEPLPFTKKFLQLSVYGGVVFMQQTFPQTLKVGQTSNTAAFNADLVTDRALKPIFGIEVPVSSIISKVKSSVGSAK